MKSLLCSAMFASTLAAILVGCAKERSDSRKEPRPMTEEVPPTDATDTSSPEEPTAPAPSTLPGEELASTSPTPSMAPVEERLTLSCNATFTSPSGDAEQSFATKVDVSDLDDNKTTQLAAYKDEIVELTSHMGRLTLTKRAAEKKERNEMSATMKTPLLALVDESSQVPATITCESEKTVPAAARQKFKCEGEISVIEADSTNNVGDTITRKVVTFSMDDQDKRVVLASHADLELVAYSDAGELTLAAENDDEWLGAGVGSIVDDAVTARLTTEKLVLQGRCEKVAE